MNEPNRFRRKPAQLTEAVMTRLEALQAEREADLNRQVTLSEVIEQLLAGTWERP